MINLKKGAWGHEVQRVQMRLNTLLRPSSKLNPDGALLIFVIFLSQRARVTIAVSLERQDID